MPCARAARPARSPEVPNFAFRRERGKWIVLRDGEPVRLPPRQELEARGGVELDDAALAELERILFVTARLFVATDRERWQHTGKQIEAVVRHGKALLAALEAAPELDDLVGSCEPRSLFSEALRDFLPGAELRRALVAGDWEAIGAEGPGKPRGRPRAVWLHWLAGEVADLWRRCEGKGAGAWFDKGRHAWRGGALELAGALLETLEIRFAPRTLGEAIQQISHSPR